MSSHVAVPPMSYDKKFIFVHNHHDVAAAMIAAVPLIPLVECERAPASLVSHIKLDLNIGPFVDLFDENVSIFQPLMASQHLRRKGYDDRIFTLFGRFHLPSRKHNGTPMNVMAYVDFKYFIENHLYKGACCFNCAARDLLISTYNFEEAP